MNAGDGLDVVQKQRSKTKKRMGISIAALVLLFLACNPVAGPAERIPPPGSAPLKLLATTLWTGANDVWASGGIVYLAFNNGLVVVDATDPAAPTELARLPLAGKPLHLSGDGGWLLVATESGVAHLIAVGHPATPRLQWTYRPPDGDVAYAAAVRGNLGYVATGQGLAVLRLAGPEPERLALAESGGCGERVRLFGDYALLAGCGLDVLTLRDPQQPEYLFGLDESQDTFDVSTDGHLLVTAGRRLRTYAWQPPARPRRLADLSFGGDLGTGVHLAGHLAYVSLEAGGLKVFDLSDPAHPAEVAHRPTRRESTGLWVEGDTLYLADDLTSMKIYTLAGDGAPELTGVFRTPNEIDAVVVEGDYAYVAAWTDGLWIVDVSDPASPRPVSQVGFGEEPPYGLSVRLDVQAGIAYLASGGMDVEDEDWDLGEAAPEEAGLLVVDARDPAAPVVLAHLLTASEATGVQVRGEYAYLADGQNFLVVDVSDPATPFVAGQIADDDWGLRDVALANDRAYLTDDGEHVVVVDITDPTAPRPVATVDSRGDPESLLTGKSVLYVGLANESSDADDGTGGLEVYDLSNPDRPERIADLALGGEVWDLALDGDTLYATDREGGIWTLDVTMPAEPRIVGFTPTSGYPFGVAVAGPAVLVADYTSLTVLGK